MRNGQIRTDDPRSPDIRALLTRHLEFCRSCSDPEDVYALDIDGLLDPTVTFCSYRRDGEVLGVGALKLLNDSHAELKSMHTATTARGQGIGRGMVEYLVSIARERGLDRISLETGSQPEFAPARLLYARSGFTVTSAFGPYPATPASTFMTLDLRPCRGSWPRG
jgi:putative acetyltransferase